MVGGWDRAHGGGGGGGFELGSETSGGTLESPRGEYGTTLARGKLSCYCTVVGIISITVVREGPIKCTCCVVHYLYRNTYV
jgi:hypothetical protein